MNTLFDDQIPKINEYDKARLEATLDEVLRNACECLGSDDNEPCYFCIQKPRLLALLEGVIETIER